MTLKNARLLIIGGSSGIGKGVATRALEEGAQVVIASKNEEKLQAAVKALGTGASYAVLDVGDEEAVKRYFSQSGKFDHIAYTAGDAVGSLFTPLAEVNIADAEKWLNVRVYGVIQVAKHAARVLAPDGSLTTTSGLLAHRPGKGTLMPTFVTGALEHVTRALAVELAPIRVNCVCPGLIRTESLDELTPEQLKQFEGACERLPVPRVGMPDDTAEAYLYSMKNGYMTGQTLFVEGGGLLQS